MSDETEHALNADDLEALWRIDTSPTIGELAALSSGSLVAGIQFVASKTRLDASGIAQLPSSFLVRYIQEHIIREV